MAAIAAEDDGHAIAFADGFDGRDDGAGIGIDKDFAQLTETSMLRRCRCDGSSRGKSAFCRLCRIFLLLPIRFQELMELRIRDIPVALRRIVLRGLRSLDDEVKDVFPSLDVAAMNDEVCRSKKCFELRLHVIERTPPDGILDESFRNVIGLWELWRLSKFLQERFRRHLKRRVAAKAARRRIAGSAVEPCKERRCQRLRFRIRERCDGEEYLPMLEEYREGQAVIFSVRREIPAPELCCREREKLRICI